MTVQKQILTAIQKKIKMEHPRIAQTGGSAVYQWTSGQAGGTIVPIPAVGSRLVNIPAWVFINAIASATPNNCVHFVSWTGVGSTDYDYMALHKCCNLASQATGSGILFFDLLSFSLAHNFLDPKILERGIQIGISGNANTVTQVTLGYYQVNVAPFLGG